MDLKAIRGISEKREGYFNKLGITCAEDLLKFFPKGYLDLTKTVKLSECYHNDIILTPCRVISAAQLLPSKRGQRFLKVYCEQAGEPFTAIWFNQPYVKSYLKTGESYYFYGRVQNKYGAVTMVNPMFERTDSNNKLKGIIPVYRLSGGLSQGVVKDAVVQAQRLIKQTSAVPLFLQKKYSLIPLEKAYADIHNPATMADVQAASARIAIEEYFILISAFKVFKGGRDGVRINRYSCSKKEVGEFLKTLPFALTDGQKNALGEIYDDLKSPVVMNRLLQGDVGSGKTVVALAAVYMAVESGFQAAILAPTEVLAYQNYQAAKKFLKNKNIAFLSGSTPKTEKKAIKDDLIAGKIDILCGTHAILTDDVHFKSLAFCVCDEQHRFGVAQRSALAEKGSADMLVMSATPIPRTLSLIVYGDLDITTIADKPAGRSDVKTVIVPEYKRENMFEYIKDEIKKGRQAYFVCPKIEDDEEGTLLSAEELYGELTEKLRGINVGLLHGKMKDKLKQSVMQDFKEKKIDALVSTTVIEVGIDVANATIMAIFGAERFGLSQLHQLRGRVGRGDIQSYCFLLTDTDGEKAIERLKLFKSTSDGFKISEYDYEMRGGGDFFGTRQSGRVISDIKDLKYSSAEIFTAKKLCDETFDSNADLTFIREQAAKKYDRLKDIVLN